MSEEIKPNDKEPLESKSHKITLIKPIVFEGKEITKVNLDLESLTGNDLSMAEREFMLMSGGQNPTAVMLTSQEYQMHLAARAAKIPVEAIKLMSARDCTQIIMEVQAFLFI